MTAPPVTPKDRGPAPEPEIATPAAEREARLAAALRANLRRRKSPPIRPR